MKRVIKAFQKFNEPMQEAIYESYLEGDLRRATFPFNGGLSDGVIYEDTPNETTFLIPIETIKSSKLSMASDDDDDDDDDSEDRDLEGADDVEGDDDDEE